MIVNSRNLGYSCRFNYGIKFVSIKTTQQDSVTLFVISNIDEVYRVDELPGSTLYSVDESGNKHSGVFLPYNGNKVYSVGFDAFDNRENAINAIHESIKEDIKSIDEKIACSIEDHKRDLEYYHEYKKALCDGLKKEY